MEFEKTISFEIKTLDSMIARKIIYEAKIEEKGIINPLQGRIMQYLFTNLDKKTYQKDIEKEYNFRRSTISGVLKTMEKNCLIVRTSSTEDARVNEIKLTEKSLKMGRKMQQLITKFETILKKDIDDKELEIFFNVISKIKKNLS